MSSKSAEFNKYAETDDEDYDDVFFSKPSGSCEFLWRKSVLLR